MSHTYRDEIYLSEGSAQAALNQRIQSLNYPAGILEVHKFTNETI